MFELRKDGPELMQMLQQQQQRTCLDDLPSNFKGVSVQLVTRAMSSSTANAGDLTGAGICIICNTGATPGTYTSRTPALMLADCPMLVPGMTWLVIMVNQVTTNAITFAAGVGATVGGTATVAGFTGRLYTAKVDSLTSITFTGLTFSWTVAGA